MRNVFGSKSKLPAAAASLVVLLFVVVAGRCAEPPPLLIGATVSLEGSYVETSAMIMDGYRLWEQQVNARGGLLGRKVKLILYDDKSREDRVRDLYEQLIVADGVDLVLSPYGTPLTLVAAEVTERHRKVMIACATAGLQPWQQGYRFLFGTYALADRYFISFTDILARNGFKSIAIVHADSPFHLSVARGAQEWARRFGLQIVLAKTFSPASPDFAAILDELRTSNPEGLIFSAYPPNSYRFLQLIEERQYRPKALALTIVASYPNFYELVGPFAEGIFGPSQWESDERIPFPGTIRFIEDFKAFTGHTPSYHAGSAYASCQLLEQAVQYVKTVDHEQMRNYISALDSVTVIGRFKVDQTGRQIGHNPILIQWQRGHKEIVYPRKMKTANPWFPGQPEP